MKPLVSVIIPVYNRSEYIHEAINSVLIQTYKNYEIIVVDDGSTIDIKKTLQPFKNKIKYRRQKHKGLAAARNTGIKFSSGEYLAFLDDDDLFEPRKLEIQVALLEENSSVGFIYSDYYLFETGNRERRKFCLAAGRDKSTNEFAAVFFTNPNIAVPTVLINRNCFKEVGLFDESLPQNEDGDLLLRIALQRQVKFSDYPSAWVRQHPARMSGNKIELRTSLIKSAEKILNRYPDFRVTLGKDANRALAFFHYLLAKAYLKEGQLIKARDELLFSLKLDRSLKYEIYFYYTKILSILIGNK